MQNSLGRLFTITTFGESHGKCMGVIVDGCPAGLPLTVADVQREVDRRRAGDNVAATPGGKRIRSRFCPASLAVLPPEPRFAF